MPTHMTPSSIGLANTLREIVKEHGVKAGIATANILAVAMQGAFARALPDNEGIEVFADWRVERGVVR